MTRRTFILSRALLAVALIVLIHTTPAHALAQPPATGTILYVDHNAPRDGDGTSWQRAFRYLQDALAVANRPSSGVSEVRVAQGRYKPDRGAGQTAGNRLARFHVANFALRGGYAGRGAPDPDERDIEHYRTVLSGDLLGDDIPGSWWNYTDNTRQILRVNDTTGSTIIEGFTIRAAFNVASQQQPIDLLGGGMRCDGGSPQILRCTFEWNRAVAGGAAFFYQCQHVIIDRCTFFHNLCHSGPDGFGGAILTLYGAGTVTDSAFIKNRGDHGGAVTNFADFTFHRCSFRENFSDERGAAFYGHPQMYDCEFIENNGYDGGAVVAGSGILVRCLFQKNMASNIGGAIFGKPTVIDSRFIENWVFYNGGGAIWGGGTFINCEFTRNSNPIVAYWGGGAVVVASPGQGYSLTGPGTYINCVFNANETVGRGGAVYVDQHQSGTFINCTFTSNYAASGEGAVYARANSRTFIYNCIIWHNSSEIGGPGHIVAQHSCIMGGWPGEGNIPWNPMFVDPLGPDGILGTGDEDLRLLPGSPCIDAGNNLALPPDTYDLNGNGDVMEPLPIDKDGNPRFVDDPRMPNTGHPPGARVMVDMGAYEFAIPMVMGDVNRDGVVDVADLLVVMDAWGPCGVRPGGCPADLNGDGVVDYADVMMVLRSWR